MGSKIAWSSTNFVEPLLWLQNLSKAKVSELDIEVLVKEDVLGLDVSVNHPSPVTVLQRFCHLSNNSSSTLLADGHHRVEVIKQLAIHTEFKDEENVGDALEHVDQLD